MVATVDAGPEAPTPDDGDALALRFLLPWRFDVFRGGGIVKGRNSLALQNQLLVRSGSKRLPGTGVEARARRPQPRGEEILAAAPVNGSAQEAGLGD